MLSFDYARAEDAVGAIALASGKAEARYLGGGTNLVDLMRENIERPRHLIDVTGLSGAIRATEDGSILIDAPARTASTITMFSTIRPGATAIKTIPPSPIPRSGLLNT